MKLSIIVTILDSHEVVRRQILHYRKMVLPSNMEIIFMDDGSEPPIVGNGLKNFNIYPTYDKRPWSGHVARNSGARKALGDYLLFMDIDYILPKESINFLMEFNGDRTLFTREFGILDEAGEFTQDLKVLRSYGLKRKYDTNAWTHRSVFAMRQELFWEMGGFREDLMDRPHPNYIGRDFNDKWKRLAKQGKVTDNENRPMIYMFPTGKYCNKDMGLFHSLKRHVNG